MAYEVRLVKSAAKAVAALEPKLRSQVLAEFDALAENPRHDGVIKLEGGAALYRTRVRSFRIIFEIDESAKVVTILEVVDRKDAYK